jgi:hypothetical protein
MELDIFTRKMNYLKRSVFEVRTRWNVIHFDLFPLHNAK